MKQKKLCKKLFLSLLIVLAMTFSVPDAIPVINNVVTTEAAVKLSSKKVTLIKGQKKQLKVTGTKTKVKWSSNKKDVVAVNAKGVVTAKKKGAAKITAKVGKKKIICTVTVETPSLSKKSVTVNVGQKYTLKINGTTQKIKWSSSDELIASVSSKGEVTGKKAGTAIITASINNVKFTSTVKVSDVVPTPTPTPILSTTDIINNNYNTLKTYIIEYGDTNDDGNKFIRLDDVKKDGEYNYAIIYDRTNSSFEFLVNAKLSESWNVLTMTVNMPYNSSSKVDDVFVELDLSSTYETSAILYMARYDRSDIVFKVDSKSGWLSYNNVQKLSNSALRLGFAGWNYLLYEKLGMNMQDIGFISYEN